MVDGVIFHFSSLQTAVFSASSQALNRTSSGAQKKQFMRRMGKPEILFDSKQKLYSKDDDVFPISFSHAFTMSTCFRMAIHMVPHIRHNSRKEDFVLFDILSSGRFSCRHVQS